MARLHPTRLQIHIRIYPCWLARPSLKKSFIALLRRLSDSLGLENHHLTSASFLNFLMSARETLRVSPNVLGGQSDELLSQITSQAHARHCPSTKAIDPQHRPVVNAFPEGDYLMRCAPEQSVGEQRSRRLAPDLHLRHFFDGNPALLLWVRVLSSNFRLFTVDEFALTPPAHLAANMRSFDLFRPADRAWMERGTRPTVPAGTRAFAALRFRLLQLADRSRPRPRPRWPRALGALVRTTT